MWNEMEKQMEQVLSLNMVEDLYANFLYVIKKFFKFNSLFDRESVQASMSTIGQ